MIEERALVVQADRDHAWVITQRRFACGICSSPCGTALIASSVHPIRLRVATTIPLQNGDEVVIGIGEAVLLASAAWVYLMPIVLVLMGAALGGGIGSHDAYSLIGGSIGLLIGFMVIRSVHRHHAAHSSWQPIVLRRVEAAHDSTPPVDNPDIIHPTAPAAASQSPS